MNLKQKMDHAPKVCMHCKTKTAKGLYVPTTKYHQEWLCNTCHTLGKNK